MLRIKVMCVLLASLGIVLAQTWQTPTQTTGFRFTRFDGEYFPGTGMVYFLGGRLGGAAMPTDGSIWRYNPATQTYGDVLIDMPIPMSNYDICLLRDDYDLAAGDTYGLYVFGGRMGTGANTDTVQVYYPRTNRTRKLLTDRYPGLVGGAIPAALGAVVTGNKAYVMGGFNATSYIVSNLVYVFDPLASPGTKWTPLPNLQFARCYIAGAVIDDSLLYAIGGDTANPTILLQARPYVERLNLRNIAAGWTRVTDTPDSIGETRAFAFNVTPQLGFNRQIILAGQGKWPAESAKCFIYTVSTNTWQAFARLDSARRNHAGAYIPGTAGTNGVPGIWVWGGRKVLDTLPLITAEFYAVGRDVGCTRILAPTGAADSGSSVTPACSLCNYGGATASYTVRMKIGAGYNATTSVSGHPAGELACVTFPPWTALPRGQSTVSCSTELSGDFAPSNDKRTGSVTVLVHDVAAVEVVAPKDTISSGNVTPRSTVRNNGTDREAVAVTLTIVDAAPPYANTVSLPQGLPAGVDTTVSFPTWNAKVGSYTARCSVFLATDENRANDTVSAPVWVVSSLVPGWHAKRPVPDQPSTRQVKDGGWLADDGDYIYAAKGNKTPDFYRYYVPTDSWATLAPVPAGVEMKPPGKGAVGVAGGGYVYAVKGNNTQGFFRYDIANDSWRQMASIPLGTTNKKVKGGSDVVYVGGRGHDTDYVYLLKGYKTEFWRYNVETDSWRAMADAPAGTKAKYDKGSWLVAKKEPGPPPKPYTLYAHKAKYHEFRKYDAVADTWYSQPLHGMPFLGMMGKSKKAKDGSCGVLQGDFIYALKGGNTQEFWRYALVGDSWDEMDTMPQYGSSLRKKKAKAGADIVESNGALYALKGNKTNELWQYVPYPLPTPGFSVLRSGALARGTEHQRSNVLRIAPNPLAGGFVTLRFSLPDACPATVRVCDVTGRTVAYKNLAATGTGATTLDLRNLPAGLYLVQLTAREYTATRKLIVQR
jgi:hypothetical protein